MFKALILSLALAPGLHATVNNTTPIEELDGGLSASSLVPVGTPVYAINNGLTGTASAAIDLSGTAGLVIGVTSTGAANVTVYFSNQAVSSTGGAVSMYSINANGSYPIAIKGRYVSFYNSSNQSTNRVSVNYLPMVSAPQTVSGTFSNGTVTAYQGTVPWVVTGNVSITAGTATIGNVGVTSTVRIDAYGSSINASGFNFLSATVISTGITTNADTVTSLTWAATTTTGPLFVDLNCAGASGLNFIITNSATTPSGFVANSSLFGYQPCGQISQVPLEVNAANTPHMHSVAVSLSNTSAALGIVTKQRP